MRALRTGGALAAALSLAAPLAAQPLVDPTRPPAGLALPERAEQVPLEAPVLQSVFISGEHRSAIISGELVVLGGRFRDSRLAAVRADQVTLDSPHGPQVLRLTPAVDWTPVARPAEPPAATKKARVAQPPRKKKPTQTGGKP